MRRSSPRSTWKHPDQPEWLSHVNANVLKVKLAMAIIGISSIHLLKTFIEVTNMHDGDAAGIEGGGHGAGVTAEGAMWQVVIHMTFIFSALALAWIDKMPVTTDLKGRLAEAESQRIRSEANVIEATRTLPALADASPTRTEA